MNGFGFLVFMFVIVAGYYVIPRIMQLDVVLADMENLDDEQLAVINEYPDVLVRMAK